MSLWNFICAALLLFAAGCGQSDAGSQDSSQSRPVADSLPDADSDNGELYLPGGFEAFVVADSTGPARHIAVNDNNDIYVKLRTSVSGQGGNVALRDTTGDGRADIIKNFGDYEDEGWLAAGMRIHDGYLYYSTVRYVFRNRLTPGELIPQSEMEMVLEDDHEHGVEHWHNSKPMAFDGRGHIYVPFGVPSNNCQEMLVSSLAATPGAPGLDPCPELEDHGGIWKFDLSKTGQTQEDATRYGTGLRSVVALSWNQDDENLYAVVHGRDNVHVLFPEYYTAWDNAMLPSEEFVRIGEDSNFGWPYCYHDPLQNRRILSPEYGGDGIRIGRCGEYDDPLVAFPGHFAPNDLLFYQGGQFPERYRNGAFVAFHGSNNRTPYPQAGYIVAFVPFDNGEPSGEWEIFADGFAQTDPVVSPRDARFRPMGLSEGPDGSLYISDSHQGRIWRIMYRGDRDDFGEADLAIMEARKSATHIRDPHEQEDNLDVQRDLSQGEMIYNTNCRSCHGQDGLGDENHFPPLAGTDWVTGDKRRLIHLTLNGLQGPIEVRGRTYDGVMPPFGFLSDEEVARVLTYIRQHFGNDASTVPTDLVREVRGE